MTSYQVAEWLRQGIAAAKAGDVERASELLLKVVDIDEYNEQAWLWLSSVVESDADREVCLENVLSINPENKLAKAGLVHLHNRKAQATPSIEPEPQPPPQPESKPMPAAAEARTDATKTDWWDQPSESEPAFELTGTWDGAPATAPASLVGMPEGEAREEKIRIRRRPRGLRAFIQRVALTVLFVLGVLAAGVAVMAFLRVGLFDPAKRDYATAMRPLLTEYDAWWDGPQGALFDELNNSCGPGADGWSNLDVLLTCNTYPAMDCAHLVSHCGSDVEAMRERAEELAREVQKTGRALLADFDAISPPEEIALAHTRFLACLQARLADAERVAQLGQGEASATNANLPLCQMFPSAEAEIQAYIDIQ